MFGLDISDHILRLVSLKKRGKRIFIDSAAEINLPIGILNEGEILKTEQLLPLMLELIQKSKRRKIGREVIACLPERKSFIKVIQVTKSNDQILPELIKSELINHIPFSLDEIYLDWQVVKSQPNSDSKKLNVLVGAVPKKIVDTYQEALKKVKLVPLALEIESIAIARAVLPIDEKIKKEAILILDLGLDRTSFIIYDNDTIQFTSGINTFSGNLITNLIKKKLSLSFKESEKAKRLAGLDDKIGKGAVASIVRLTIKDLLLKIDEFIDFYKAHYPQGNAIKRIILSGGGANLKNLNKELEKLLKIKIEIGNSLTNIEKSNIPSLITKKQSSYNTAIGLALRGIYYDHP